MECVKITCSDVVAKYKAIVESNTETCSLEMLIADLNKIEDSSCGSFDSLTKIRQLINKIDYDEQKRILENSPMQGQIPQYRPLRQKAVESLERIRKQEVVMGQTVGVLHAEKYISLRYYTLHMKIEGILDRYKALNSSTEKRNSLPYDEVKFENLDSLCSRAIMVFYELIKHKIQRDNTIYASLPTVVKNLEEFIKEKATIHTGNLYRYDSDKKNKLAIARMRNAYSHSGGTRYLPFHQQRWYVFNDKNQNGSDEVEFAIGYSDIEIILNKVVDLLEIMTETFQYVLEPPRRISDVLNFNIRFADHIISSKMSAAEYIDKEFSGATDDDYFTANDKQLLKSQVVNELQAYQEFYDWIGEIK